MTSVCTGALVYAAAGTSTTARLVSSAGIDMALHLVARLAGSTAPVRVRRAIRYDPQSPV